MSIVFNNKPIKVTKHGNTRYELIIKRKLLGLNHRSYHKTLREAKRNDKRYRIPLILNSMLQTTKGPLQML